MDTFQACHIVLHTESRWKGTPLRHSFTSPPVKSDAHGDTGTAQHPKVTHPYNTRRSTRTAHPTRAVGLYKRTREEIAQQASQKAATQRTKDKQLEDSHQQEDVATEQYLRDGSHAPGSEGEDDLDERVACNVHTQARDPANEQLRSLTILGNGAGLGKHRDAPKSPHSFDWDEPTDSNDELGATIRSARKLKCELGKVAARAKKMMNSEPEGREHNCKL
ncbi:hypothetical protein C8Q78DRAFT_1083416 [Trametes maxima]|nr:hypothetical protein C8Q78DRAFT_1083416 [Trametes maxima]